MSTDDRIEKKIVLHAPRARVWRALADVEEFGRWFGVRLSGSFAPGARLRGKVTHKGYEHVDFEILVERVEPESLLSWRWHPNAIDPNVDYSGETTTLVVFELADALGGTLLTLVESGFDGIPPTRRSAFGANERGWTIQMTAIEKYVSEKYVGETA